MGRGENLSEENRVCAAQLPPQAGGTPRIRPDPGPSPAAATPTCLGGRGRRGGPDVTHSLSQSELPFPSPQGDSRARVAAPGATRQRRPPNLGLKELLHLAGETEAESCQGGSETLEKSRRRCPPARLLSGPERGRSGRASHSGAAGRGALKGGAQAAGRRCPSPQAPGTRPDPASAHLGAPRPAGPLRVSPGPLGPRDAAGPRREEGVCVRGRRQNPHWIAPGVGAGRERSAALPGRSGGETEA